MKKTANLILQFFIFKNAKPVFLTTFSKIHDISLYFKYFRAFFGKITDFVNLDEKGRFASCFLVQIHYANKPVRLTTIYSSSSSSTVTNV